MLPTLNLVRGYKTILFPHRTGTINPEALSGWRNVGYRFSVSVGNLTVPIASSRRAAAHLSERPRGGHLLRRLEVQLHGELDEPGQQNLGRLPEAPEAFVLIQHRVIIQDIEDIGAEPQARPPESQDLREGQV